MTNFLVSAIKETLPLSQIHGDFTYLDFDSTSKITDGIQVSSLYRLFIYLIKIYYDIEARSYFHGQGPGVKKETKKFSELFSAEFWDIEYNFCVYELGLT